MSDPGKATDPYAAVSVHGLWPLVLDDAAAAGLRFADLERDAPEDCVSSPGELPNASLSLRSFNNTDERSAWAKAACEFGGNAVVVIPGPAVYGMAFQYALVVRLDRDRPVGALTLEEAIPLLRDAERKVIRTDGREVDPALIGADGRARILGNMAETRGRRAWAARWKAEIEAMKASGALKPNEHPHALGPHLPFSVGNVHGEAGRVEGEPGALHVVLRHQATEALDPDLRRAWEEAVRTKGWTPARDTVSLDAVALDPALAAKVAADAHSLWAFRTSVEARRAARLTLLSLSLDPETTKVLRRIAEGYPVASGRVRDPAAQFNPRTGKVQVVAASRVRKAHATGLVRPIWWKEASRGKDRGDFPVQALDYLESVLWGLTETGRAVVDGRLDLAELTQPAEEATALAWSRGVATAGVRLPRPHEGLKAVAARLPAPPAGTAEKVASLVRNETGSRVPTWPNGLAVAGVALACGVLVVDGEHLRRGEARPATASSAQERA